MKIKHFLDVSVLLAISDNLMALHVYLLQTNIITILGLYYQLCTDSTVIEASLAIHINNAQIGSWNQPVLRNEEVQTQFRVV